MPKTLLIFISFIAGMIFDRLLSRPPTLAAVPPPPEGPVLFTIGGVNTRLGDDPLGGALDPLALARRVVAAQRIAFAALNYALSSVLMGLQIHPGDNELRERANEIQDEINSLQEYFKNVLIRPLAEAAVAALEQQTMDVNAEAQKLPEATTEAAAANPVRRQGS